MDFLFSTPASCLGQPSVTIAYCDAIVLEVDKEVFFSGDFLFIILGWFAEFESEAGVIDDGKHSTRWRVLKGRVFRFGRLGDWRNPRFHVNFGWSLCPAFFLLFLLVAVQWQLR